MDLPKRANGEYPRFAGADPESRFRTGNTPLAQRVERLKTAFYTMLNKCL